MFEMQPLLSVLIQAVFVTSTLPVVSNADSAALHCSLA